jgi:glycosyltransferase involved in cell wall biosynthesis
MKEPLVSVTIPTLNSARTLELCLDAVQQQTYGTIEVSVVDGGSTDQTLAISTHHPLKPTVAACPDALLAARYEGVKLARGEFILLLDSDQVLEPDAIKQSVATVQQQKFDMLMLEEDVYKSDTWIERLFRLDRQLIHAVGDLSPLTGVMLPRFYKAELLRRAFEGIPGNVIREAGGQDHAIIYLEAWRLSKNVGMVSNAVRHVEPDSLSEVVRKFYRWGRTSVGAHYDKYEVLLAKKQRPRRGLFSRGLLKQSVGSLVLSLIKAGPYFAGYLIGRRGKQKSADSAQPARR